MPLIPKRKTVIASGLLCCALALIVLFTGPGTFRSPAAVVVLSAIGAAAVLFQLLLRQSTHGRPAMVLNALGVLFALAALFPSELGIGPLMTQAMALASVMSFAIGSALILHSLRKSSPKPE